MLCSNIFKKFLLGELLCSVFLTPPNLISTQHTHKHTHTHLNTHTLTYTHTTLNTPWIMCKYFGKISELWFSLVFLYDQQSFYSLCFPFTVLLLLTLHHTMYNPYLLYSPTFILKNLFVCLNALKPARNQC